MEKAFSWFREVRDIKMLRATSRQARLPKAGSSNQFQPIPTEVTEVTEVFSEPSPRDGAPIDLFLDVESMLQLHLGRQFGEYEMHHLVSLPPGLDLHP